MLQRVQVRVACFTNHVLIKSSINNSMPCSYLTGKYDVGIRQIEGHKIEFVEKPRTFCFRGSTAKDEKVYVYRVAVDSGFTAENALEMFNEAKETEVPQPAGRNGWLGRGVRRQIVSGFYIDERDFLRRSNGYGKKVSASELKRF